MRDELLASVTKLPLPDRLELVEALWQSLVSEGYEPEPGPGQLEELDRRVQAHQAAPEDVTSAEQVFEAIRKRIAGNG